MDSNFDAPSMSDARIAAIVDSEPHDHDLLAMTGRENPSITDGEPNTHDHDPLTTTNRESDAHASNCEHDVHDNDELAMTDPDEFLISIARHLTHAHHRAAWASPMVPRINEVVRRERDYFQLHGTEDPERLVRLQQHLSNMAPAPETCDSCSSIISVSFDLPACDHMYCEACIVRMFELSITGESTFPPACCGKVIPIQLLEERIDDWDTLLPRFRTKEAAVFKETDIYCYVARCSAKIARCEPLEGEGAQRLVCDACAAVTCGACKGAAHKEAQCPPMGKEETEFRELASRKGWKECYRCHRFVELSKDCNHITCLCSAEFCYLCGKPWLDDADGDCGCPL